MFSKTLISPFPKGDFTAPLEEMFIWDTKITVVVHGCYRGSRPASAMVAATVSFHSFLGTWSQVVDVFIAYSQFAMDKFIQGGLPAEKLAFMELVEHERTGLHFRPSDSTDLADKINWLLAHPQALSWMRQEARAEFEATYTAAGNYNRLMEIYESALIK